MWTSSALSPSTSRSRITGGLGSLCLEGLGRQKELGSERQEGSLLMSLGDNLRLDDGQIEVLDDAMAELLRCKTPAERIKIGFSLWTSAHNMLTTHLKRMHPEWNSLKINQEVARRLSHGAVRAA